MVALTLKDCDVTAIATGTSASPRISVKRCTIPLRSGADLKSGLHGLSGLIGYADIYGVGVGPRYHRNAVSAAGNTPVEGVTVHPTGRGRDRQCRVIRHNVIKSAVAIQAVCHTLRRVGGVDQIAGGCPRRANDGARQWSWYSRLSPPCSWRLYIES